MLVILKRMLVILKRMADILDIDTEQQIQIFNHT